jgi:Cof subfamily protein (haloacid dehalogenase superfamily)
MKERLAKIRLVISDMDGTLLDHKNSLPERTALAIRQLENSGRAKFAVGTGRSRSRAGCPFPDSFNFFSRPGIFLNGAQVHGLNGELINDKVLGPHALTVLVNSLAQYFPDILSLVICTGDECVAYPDSSAFSLYLAARYADPHPASSDQSLDVLGSRAHMLSILVKDPQHDLGWLNDMLSELSSQLNLKVTRSLPNLLCVVPGGISKASGVLSIAKSCGLDVSEVAVVGDAMNDLEMLKCAGLAVAVSNAVPELKEVAHWVVNAHDHPELPGVAQLIEALLLA